MADLLGGVFFSDEEIDVTLLLAAISGYIEGVEPDLPRMINEEKIEHIVRWMRVDFPAKGGVEEASAFKKVANFFCYFIGERPIKGKFSEAAVGKSLSAIDNHINVMTAYHLCVRLLHGATIKKKSNGSLDPIVLENKILVSKHSYIDIIESCKTVTVNTHFLMVAVLFEQLAYRANPDASNPVII